MQINFTRDRPSYSTTNSTLKSWDPTCLKQDFDSRSMTMDDSVGGRSAPEHINVSERRIFQFVDPGNASKGITSCASCRNKILPLISDVV